MPKNSPIIISTKKHKTQTHSPLFIYTKPLHFNTANTSHTKKHPTLKNTINSHSNNNYSPSPNSQQQIIYSNSSSTISKNFLHTNKQLHKLQPITNKKSSIYKSNTFIKPIL